MVPGLFFVNAAEGLPHPRQASVLGHPAAGGGPQQVASAAGSGGASLGNAADWEDSGDQGDPSERFKAGL